ncbi:MAG: class I tRNA ligase family protein, partial [bacterium]|nr:class I tRNA ligase family protein [bacterium]
MELPKVFESQNYEEEIYRKWEESGFFNPDNLTGDSYSIMMPPPNVTGVLHLGHALENALMDTMARFQRMQGKKVLLIPGTDHAAVATQAKVESMLIKEGIKNPREELGRDGLLNKVREYAENSKKTILSQIRAMGTSCDWSRLAYTFDNTRSRAVNEVFVKMYNDGLIYRGYRVINWSVKGQSTCSDDELVYVERPGKLYYFKYSKDFPITIATTRPETKLGDTAVAVHPEDGRYKNLIGQKFTVDIGAQSPLVIHIIADVGIDPNFGTGALGVTPAHSTIDFEMYLKEKAQGNDIGLIPVIGEDGKMTIAAGVNYAGLSVEEARAKFVQYLRDNDLLEKEEDTMQNVGTSDRFNDVVEPLPKTQWFVDVNKLVPGTNKTLKDMMRDAVLSGDERSLNKIKITPERFEKQYFGWIDNLRDWCISRQIWWGHRIPVWYRGMEIFCGTEAPSGEEWVRDSDTLDTWFSSGMWTFSTLGWPEKTADFKTFHPSSWMQMGYEIL